MQNINSSGSYNARPSPFLQAAAQGAGEVADPSAQRNQLRQQMRQHAQLIDGAPGQPGGRLSTLFAGARNRTVGDALEHAREFYDARLDDATNADLMGMHSTQVARNAPEVRAGLTRKASFLTIARQAEDVGKLLQQDALGRMPRLDGDARSALEAVLHTVKFNAEDVQLAAAKNAVDGARALPLALDHARFRNFLGNREAVLESVVNACRTPSTAAARLQPLLQQFAEEYLGQNNRLPTGMLLQETLGPGLRAGQMARPITIQFGNGDGTQEKIFESNRNQDMAAIVLNQNVLTGSLDNYKSRLARFTHLEPAKQRAALVMQILVGALVSTEESIVGGLRSIVHAPSAAAQQQAVATRSEIDYAGVSAIGGSCDPGLGGISQRAAAMKPISQLRDRVRAYESRHNEPAVRDMSLRNWISGPRFADDVRATLNPATRLRLAQADTTAQLLAASRALR